MLRVLELFCGIGGCAAAIGHAARIVAAVDIHRAALDAYAHNFPHPTVARSIESLTATQLAEFDADVWWLSPPCQPYTKQGVYRDENDPRAVSLATMTEYLAELRPRYLALENVPGFAASRMHQRLLRVLRDRDYQTYGVELCASGFGLPQRRRRYYLVASRSGDLEPLALPQWLPQRLPGLLDPDTATRHYAEDDYLSKYHDRLHIVSPTDATAMTRCFTSAYGRSPLRSGSYLADSAGSPRHFSPSELLRLFGFPLNYRMPPRIGLRPSWAMIGKSLAVPVVRHVLSAIPSLAHLASGH